MFFGRGREEIDVETANLDDSGEQLATDGRMRLGMRRRECGDFGRHSGGNHASCDDERHDRDARLRERDQHEHGHHGQHQCDR